MNDYDQFARLYDLEHRDYDHDIALYVNFAQRCDGPVLELGCGSGRVCLALAQAGLDVVGIDSSPAMLSLARARAAASGIAKMVQLEEADVCALTFQDQFALVLYPLNGFLHLLTAEDQLAALRCAYRALMPGGFLIVDLPNPHAVFDPRTDGQVYLRRRFSSLEGQAIASFTQAQTDLAAQRQLLTVWYDETDGEGSVRRTMVETELRFVYRHEMALLLQEAGLALDAVYGTYELDAYDASSELMLVVAYRPDAA